MGVRLLEEHHTVPYYTRFRRVAGYMSSWRNSSPYSYWGGATRKSRSNGGNGAKGKSKGKDKSVQDKKKSEEGQKDGNTFPAYDKMEIPKTAAATMSASSSSKDGQWAMQHVLQGLVEANPGLKLTPELEQAIQGSKSAETKKDLYDQQRTLNAKRKASQKLDRMEQALKRKRFQMDAYREQIRQQLQAEMTRFAAETKDLEEAIAMQKEIVDRLEKGIVQEEDENMENFVDVQEQHSLAALLGLQDDKESEERIAQLQKEKQEALMQAQRMQEKLTIMMATAPMPGLAGTSQSPQMPYPDGRKRPKIEVEQKSEFVEEICDSPAKLPHGGMD